VDTHHLRPPRQRTKFLMSEGVNMRVDLGRVEQQNGNINISKTL
jgi:hypothetical protein